MKVVQPADVRVVITEYLTRKLTADSRGFARVLSDDCDLLLSGLIDSLGLLELVGTLGEHFGRELTFDELDPEQMTIVGPLCQFVAKQLAQC
jgi:acyl carrier protein